MPSYLLSLILSCRHLCWWDRNCSGGWKDFICLSSNSFYGQRLAPWGQKQLLVESVILQLAVSHAGYVTMMQRWKQEFRKVSVFSHKCFRNYILWVTSKRKDATQAVLNRKHSPCIAMLWELGRIISKPLKSNDKIHREEKFYPIQEPNGNLFHKIYEWQLTGPGFFFYYF